MVFGFWGGNFAGILVKGMYELWGEGSSYEELKESVLSYPDERKLPYLDSDSTFKITVDSFGKVISLEDQKELIQGLSYIPFKVGCSFNLIGVEIMFTLSLSVHIFGWCRLGKYCEI